MDNDYIKSRILTDKEYRKILFIEQVKAEEKLDKFIKNIEKQIDTMAKNTI